MKGNGIQLNHSRVVVLAVALLGYVATAAAEPVLTVTPAYESGRAGTVWPIHVEVTWIGEADEWHIAPPEIAPVDWASIEVRRGRSFQRDDTHGIVFTVEVIPHAAGDFELPAIRVAFLSPEELSPPEQSESPAPSARPDAPPQLRADPLTLRVLPQRTMAWILGLLGALFVLLLLPIGWRRARLTRTSPTDPEPAAAAPSPEGARVALDACRKHRMEGAYYEFYAALARAAGCATSETSPLAQQLRTRAQEVGYGGAHPTPDEMDGHLRAVERVLHDLNTEAVRRE